MRWETITSGLGSKAFALLNNGRRLLTLAFHPSSNCARVEYENEKRVFLFRREGLFRNRIVLCNEYGIRIGRVGTEKKSQFIELDKDRYFFTISDTSSPAKQIAIYTQSNVPPVAVCSIDTEESSPSAYGLIMILCWYLFNPLSGRSLAV